MIAEISRVTRKQKIAVIAPPILMGLMIGSGLMGFYLSFLVHKTGTIWWAIVAHTLGGIIMVL
jgi:hypothetical protein